jgi:UDP-N-acetylglucosamine 1-carboxyvinyltransferase
VVAALCADGTSTLDNVFHLDRGYQDIELKLGSLGAHVTRLDAETEVEPDLSKVVGD